jgi:hypothetical protein
MRITERTSGEAATALPPDLRDDTVNGSAIRGKDWGGVHDAKILGL